jgi:hypothetical protein
MTIGIGFTTEGVNGVACSSTTACCSGDDVSYLHNPSYVTVTDCIKCAAL